jgi:hypothetical protein
VKRKSADAASIAARVSLIHGRAPGCAISRYSGHLQ